MLLSVFALVGMVAISIAGILTDDPGTAFMRFGVCSMLFGIACGVEQIIRRR